VEEERKAHPEVSDPLGLDEDAPSEAPKQTAEPTDQERKQDEDELKSARELLHRLDALKPYYQTNDGSYLAVRIIPETETIDVEKNRELLKGLEDHISKFGFQRFDPKIRTQILGSIPDHVDRYLSIRSDVSFGGLGILAVILIVIFYFSSLWAIPVLVPSLVTGLSIGLAVVSLTETTLNTIAVFLVAVVFGVGIEFGIHLWARFLQEKEKNNDAFLSLTQTWNSTGRATITSAFALLAGFALLTLSSFQGFAQFGRVAIVLLTAVAGSSLLFMPSWIFLAEKFRWKRLRGPRVELAQRLTNKISNLLPERMPEFTRLFSLLVVGISIVLCVAKLSFDYRFDEKVVKRSTSDGRKAQGEIFTERLKPSAIAVFPLEKDAANFLEFYRKNKVRFPDIALMSGLPSFLPIDQKERILKLQEISDRFEVSWLKKFKDLDVRRVLEEIKEKAYSLKPHTLSDLPPELIEPFLSSDAKSEYLIFIFDLGGETDGRKSMKFSDAVQVFQDEAGLHPLIGGQELILADIVRRVIEEGPFLVLGMFFLIFLICWFDFRSLSHALITMVPVLAGFAMTGAVMVISGRQINFFNMVALASLGAMVVDNSIHLYHRYLELSGKPFAVQKACISVVPSIFTCTCTSICGYGGMLLANHSGISSLGFVADIGLLCCFVSGALFFPAWLSLKEDSKRIT